MGGATRVVQTGIGLMAELKAAKNGQKAHPQQIATAADSIAHRDQLLSEVQQLRISASETETDPVRRHQLKGEIAQLRIKQTSSSSTSSSTSSSPQHSSRPQFTASFASHSQPSSDHFGDDQPPLYAPDTVYPDDLDSDSSDSPPPYTPDELAAIPDPLNVKFPSPNSTFTPTKLQHPVIIPQRRPGSKTRGFLRAYAPALADHDIDQETFLTFLKSFHKASQASPILTAITLGAGSLGQIPEPGSMLLGLGVTMLSGAAENLQQRYRTNAYLDVANEKLFKPRGLYCLIMSFRPGAVPEGAVAVEAVDTSKHAMKWLDGPSQSTFKTNYRNSSGTTNGEVELPKAAALVYPEPDAKMGRSKSAKEDSSKNAAAYSKRKVAANYFDKRAQAAYAFKHPTSSLATETTPTFASKYGDPTNPAVTTSDTGRFMSKYKHESLQERQFRERAKELEKAAAKTAKNEKEGKVNGNGRFKQNLGDMNFQVRAPDIVQNILYLMVVDLPSEEMMATAKASARESTRESARAKEEGGRSIMV